MALAHASEALPSLGWLLNSAALAYIYWQCAEPYHVLHYDALQWLSAHEIISVVAIRSRLLGKMRKADNQQIMASSSYCLIAVDRCCSSVLSYANMHGTS